MAHPCHRQLIFLDFVSSQKITELVHERLGALVQTGDRVVDATAGNGFDTLFLARCVGESGEVLAVDVQKVAIEEARDRLERHGLRDRVEFICADHGDLLKHLPAGWTGWVRAVVFNLGYLPGSGGNKEMVTEPESTLSALDQSLEVLMPGGVLSVAIYHTHPGGREEMEAVLKWANLLKGTPFRVELVEKENPRAPKLLWVERPAG